MHWKEIIEKCFAKIHRRATVGEVALWSCKVQLIINTFDMLQLILPTYNTLFIVLSTNVVRTTMSNQKPINSTKFFFPLNSLELC